jgi:hypothetical protein
MANIEINEEAPIGDVYLICLGAGISRGKQTGNARHYIGWTSDVKRRFKEHTGGTDKASPLITAAIEAGCEPKLARVWPDVTRAFERFVKNQKHTPRHCPICTPKSKGIILDIEPIA